MKHCTLIQIDDNIWTVKNNTNIDLIYSEDDNGYYFQNARKVSKVYNCLHDAVIAYELDKIKFNKI